MANDTDFEVTVPCWAWPQTGHKDTLTAQMGDRGLQLRIEEQTGDRLTLVLPIPEARRFLAWLLQHADAMGLTITPAREDQ